MKKKILLLTLCRRRRNRRRCRTTEHLRLAIARVEDAAVCHRPLKKPKDLRRQGLSAAVIRCQISLRQSLHTPRHRRGYLEDNKKRTRARQAV
ncbi:hypothetical protein LINPERHAP2_LOCUS4467 [Linum perenne]